MTTESAAQSGQNAHSTLTPAAVWISAAIVLASIVWLLGNVFAGRQPPPTHIVYQLPQQQVVAAPAATPALAPPASSTLVGYAPTTVHNYAAAEQPAPVTFASGGYEVVKRCGWSDKVGGFTVIAPAGGRDALNAQSTANDWRAQEVVAHNLAQREAVKNPPIQVINRTVTVPVPMFYPTYRGLPYRGYYYPYDHASRYSTW
jgi:hypothetical protein